MLPPEVKREGSSSGIVIPEMIRHITTIVDRKFVIDLPALKARGVPYDGVWVGKHSRSHLQDVVPVEERALPMPENVVILSQSPNDEIAQLMKEVTGINFGDGVNEVEIENPDLRFKYQSKLEKVFQRLGESLKTDFDTDNAVFFPPQRGADLIQAFFQSQGVITNPENIVQYELKREYLSDGIPVVGRIDKYYPEGEFETGIFIDDCLASDASASASIKIMKEKYPSLKKIIIVVSAATRRGLEEAAKENLGVTFIAATTVYAMNDHFYLLRTPEETDLRGKHYSKDKDVFYVGDMGAWAEKLPAEFNDDAPWNVFRKAA